MLNPIHINFIGKSRAEEIEGSLKTKGAKKERIKFSGFADEKDHYAIAIGSAIEKAVPHLGFWDKKRYVVLKVVDKEGHEGFVKVNASSLKKRLELDETQWKSAINEKTPEKRMEAVSILVANRLRAIVHEKADKKDPEANFRVGIEEENEGKLADAFSHFEVASKRGYKDADSKYAEVCFQLANQNEGTEESLKLYRKAAKLGHSKAAVSLGLHFEKNGSIKEAEKWYRKGASQGHLESMHGLGKLLTESDPVEAEKWLFKAASEGRDDALLDLINIYFDHHGTISSQNLIKMLEKRSEEGSARAQVCLGMLYDDSYDLHLHLSPIISPDNLKSKELYEKAAAKNDAQAIFELGYIAEVEKNDQEAIKKYASIPQHIRANLYLGKIYMRQATSTQNNFKQNLDKAFERFEAIVNDSKADYFGVRGEAYYNLFKICISLQKWTEAASFLKSAAESGYREALFDYANRLLKGDAIIERNIDQAFDILSDLAELKGDIPAMKLLGSLYERGDGFSKNENEAIKWYEKAAKEGDSSAMLHLAEIYSGIIFPSSQIMAEAYRWYSAAAEAGEEKAMYHLGLIYEFGLNEVSADHEKAVAWYEKALKRGYDLATTQLGLFFERIGDPESLKKAVGYYQRAAKMEQPHAMVFLGNCYATGLGIQKDWKKAIHYFEEASKRGLTDATLNLGCCYAQGLGVEKNAEEAVRLFEQVLAVNPGSGISDTHKITIHDYALYNLAMCYATGFGVPKDLSRMQELIRKIYLLDVPFFIQHDWFGQIKSPFVERDKEWKNSTKNLFVA